MLVYIVKTDGGYLYPLEGEVSYTDDATHAGYFLQAEEAHVLAQVFGYTEGHYRVIPVEINKGKAEQRIAEWN